VASVYYRKTTDRRAFTLKVLEQFRGEIEKAKTFLIKPNIVSYEPYPTTTHPELLEAVLEFLEEKDVVVADAPAVDAGSSRKIIANSPLKKVCDAFNVPLIDLYTTKVKKFVTERGYKFRIHALALEKDFVISLPVLKVHTSTDITGALKNQFGYLTRAEKIWMHMGVKDIHKGIDEVNVVAKPNLTIVDVVQTLISAQEIRHGGKVKDLGYMLAGSDPVALDSFGLTLLQQVIPSLSSKSPEDIPHIKYATDYGLGSSEFAEKML
jgi:uncharacterized protein (DUF362 family)